MSRARELFDRLRHGGFTALGALIDDREPESLFLDFKRSEGDGRGTRLADSDNKNLSKAISGFANSSGGVVVWGVDCRRRPETGNEEATLHPLSDAKGFETKLQSAVSRTTMPAFSGVEFYSFVAPAGNPAGFVAMYVPQSLIGPIRGLVGEQYYIRAGSDFVPTPHDVLAGMFGRVPLPQVEFNLIQYQAIYDASTQRMTSIVGIGAVNVGSVPGERPYLSLAWDPVHHESLDLQSPDEQHIKVRRWSLPCASILTANDFLLPPGASEELCRLYWRSSTTAPASVELRATLGVRGAAPTRRNLSVSDQDFQAAVEHARKAGGTIRSTPIRLAA